MKLTVLGGGGVRMPGFVRAVLADRPDTFDRIALFEPDEFRRRSIGRLAVELGSALGRSGVVQVTDDIEEAFTGADFVFSAIRVGGDRGRVVDEQVASERGLVGQETTGPGGAAMALRTIPVVLGYCEILARVAPRAVLINFTNPAGIITQAVTAQGKVRAVGVCDTPTGTLRRIGEFLGSEEGSFGFSYAGLNHLGWITSVTTGGEEAMGEILRRYEELQAFDHRFAMFDPALVRRLGSIPTEYLYYYYDAGRYVAGVAQAGHSRGQDVERLNDELLSALMRAFDSGDVGDAWQTYNNVIGVRRDTYMRLDADGDNGQAEARAARAGAGLGVGLSDLRSTGLGGYESVALQVIDGLVGTRPAGVIVNTRNGTSVDFLDPHDVVEVAALVDGAGISALASGGLPAAARGLVIQVKEYERTLVEAAAQGDAGLAELALSQHPLVPGITVARDLLSAYRERHGSHLAYLR